MKRVFIILLFILYSSSVLAFKFSPMSTSLEFQGPASSTLFYVENDSSLPIAVQMSLLKREMNELGEEKNSAISDELSVYPSQLILRPNEKRSIKVSWNARPATGSELNYRLVAEQLPIDLQQDKSKKANIKILLRYVAALYVTDEKFTSNLIFRETTFKDNDVIFTVENLGNKHQVLGNLELRIVDTVKKTELIFSGDDLKGMIGENVLAQSKRHFKFPKTGKFAKILPSSQVKMSFDKN